jgi:hypothetical protein
MRNPNDGRDNSLISSPMIVCDQRRNKPRLDYKICEATCGCLNGCENYRAWYKKSFSIDLPAEKKRKSRKDKPPTREEIKKREERISGTTEAYSILTQALIAKQPKRRGRPPGSKNKAQS